MSAFTLVPAELIYLDTAAERPIRLGDESSLESLLDDYTDAESDSEREGILGRALDLWFRAGCEGELSGCVEDAAWELREGWL